jgi:hypothetical protein
MSDARRIGHHDYVLFICFQLDSITNDKEEVL